MTHVTDVKPLVEVVTYTDQQNGNEVYQEVGLGLQGLWKCT